MDRRTFAALALGFTLLTAGPVAAHDDHATPVASSEPDITLVLVEHAGQVTNVDQGEPGTSPSDLIVWGPNPLYDEADVDTGATTQGVCTAIHSGDCLLLETIVFPDGSTLELQGVQPGTPMESTRTIVGGSGIYLGAYGVVTVEPTDDLEHWTKTFEIWLS
jgi:hypothetical protein